MSWIAWLEFIASVKIWLSPVEGLTLLCAFYLKLICECMLPLLTFSFCICRSLYLHKELYLYLPKVKIIIERIILF